MIHNIIINQTTALIIRPSKDLYNWILNPSSNNWRTNLVLFKHWLKSLNSKEIFYSPYLPSITYKAITWLDSHLTQNSKVFEWGSGMSTLYLLKKCKQVISIEHDKSWHSKLLNQLRASSLDLRKLTYLFIPPNEIKTLEKNYRSTNHIYKGYSFKKYCRAINSYPNHYFDLAIVDGRARNSCVTLSINKVKNKGYIIFDNTDRTEYANSIKNLLKKGFIVNKLTGYSPQSRSNTETSIIQIIHRT